jgi:DNA-binding transcriptional ArsR family regulator
MQTQIFDAFRVVADPGRRKMLQMIAENSMTISSLAANFDMSRPAVSQHVKILSNAGFISIKDIGRERYCTLKQEGFNELRDFIDYFDQFLNSKFNDLDAV